jgi:hypothetical protein
MGSSHSPSRDTVPLSTCTRDVSGFLARVLHSCMYNSVPMDMIQVMLQQTLNVKLMNKKLVEMT